MSQVFVRRHKLDSWFWLLVWTYSSVIICFGFAPPVEDRFFDDVQEPASLQLVIHVWSFSAWMVLLGSQAFFAATKRMSFHRLAGTAMLPLAAVMVWSGLTSELEFHAGALERGRETADFFAITATYLLTFAVLVPLAWRYRHQSPTHKRLVLLATASILSGAHMRIWGGWWPDAWFDDTFVGRLLFYFGGTLIIVSMGMIHDLVTRRALHRTYVYGVPALFVSYLLAVMLHDSPAWAAFIRPWLAG